MLPAARTCVICDAPVPFHLPPGGHTCGDARCRWECDRIPPQQRCATCGRPLVGKQAGLRFCPAWECRGAHDEAAALEREKRRERLVVELEDQALRLREQAGVAKSQSYPLALVSSFTHPLTELPESRRQMARDHIAGLIAQVERTRGEPVEVPPPMPTDALAPEARAVLGRVCGQCGGDCCRTGGTHAHLTAASVRRFMDAHPEQGPEEVLEAYLGRIARLTNEGSCVFHQPNGCALPRDMRGDLCNRYLCGGLEALLPTFTADALPRAFAACAYGSTILRAAFIDEEGSHVVSVEEELGAGE
jgi:hypothetical protein